MNADERTPGQQGYGQQSPQQAKDGETTPKQAMEGDTGTNEDGGMATGQAAYGNSGETDTLSQNSSDLGQESDLGQSRSSGLFGGSDSDMGNSGQNSDDQTGSRETGLAEDSGDQTFAEQGQGALDQDSMGTTDIEIERSQGRDNNIEGGAS